MTIGEYSGVQDLETHADQSPLGAVLVARSGQIEEILACAGVSRPLGWHQEALAPVVTVYVRKDWCYCISGADEQAWHDAEERICAEIGWPVRLVEVTTSGAQAMISLQALNEAEPWGDGNLSWAHALDRTMRAGLMIWADLAAQMEYRLRATVG